MWARRERSTMEQIEIELLRAVHRPVPRRDLWLRGAVIVLGVIPTLFWLVVSIIKFEGPWWEAVGFWVIAVVIVLAIMRPLRKRRRTPRRRGA